MIEEQKQEGEEEQIIEIEKELIPPNNTLYVNNLNENVKINELIPELKRIFEEFGDVIQIKAKRNIKMRGQAFITFQDIPTAEKALENCQGRKLYGKQMELVNKMEVRLVPQKKVAFVEYEDEFKAGVALQSLSTFKIGDNIVTVNYAKA
ncbi:u1 small nuclear ribonucleoprotein a, putative [Ichthyophthirius multifiliis]|uniref:U1 small nuclear ribonucleoprotein a, putative n=1 Tax=Ichthyophthirius multifiliis TaxID=5932 RepID=G0QYH6_ICHMU|nr:u1 small nuclear ribonucleoprotein a, putative [Ichthyophthirius multifiliis]EGR29728.1 u1 small nuclear ribonucleoprotein a, putative [Ichthyophthirius multifiliis]|eukprot:XP_004030964.1 u1 small nuclear ribonucleoprotein a, putative [Ichthyophthirius multifiliis]